MTHALPLFDAPAIAPSDDAGLGALETPRGCLPLIALDVRGDIAGLLAHTSVRQTFRNAFDEPLEATYIFPLPDRAAVTRFRMTVGTRVIEGELKERAQAREDYETAIEQGHRAALAEEDRSGVFTMRVGNILPHEEAIVELEMVGPLEISDDEATYRFPLVVAPRYTPGVPLDGPTVGDGVAPDTDQVPDASRVTPPVLLPGFPNPVRLSLEVRLDPAGLSAGLSGVRSSLHSVMSEDSGPPWTIRLQPGERLNRDFILRFPVAREAVQTALQCSGAAQGQPGVFALTLTPPTMAVLQPRPREVVFVLDRSGSMTGWKMVAARRALGRMIDTLLDQDHFTVLAFDDLIETPEADAGGSRRSANRAGRGQANPPSTELLTGANRERWRVLEWLGKIDARGGTEMGPALEFAMRCFSSTADDVDRVLVVVTDGQVSGENALLRTLKKAAGGRMPRVFTLGIDQAVNAGFLRRLADLGGGACDLVESEDRLDEALDGVHRLIGQPVLTEVRLELIDFDGVTDSLAPTRVSGLYPGRPLMVFGRHLSDKPQVRLRVHAVDAGGKPWTAEVAAQPGPGQVLLNLWGRAKVRELEDRYAAGGGHDTQLAERIVKVSLESGVLSRFTAYVAVDRAEVVNPGGQQHQIVQPVELPAGWEMAGAPGALPRLQARADAMAVLHSYSMPKLDKLSRRKARALPPSALASDHSLPGDEDDLLQDAGPRSETRSRRSPLISLGSLVGQLLGMLSGRRKKIGRATLVGALAELRQAVERMLQAAAPPSRDEFAALVESLAALTAVLQRGGHSATKTMQDLANEGYGLLVVWDLSDDAIIAKAVTPFLRETAQTLENLHTAWQAERGAFWK